MKKRCSPYARSSAADRAIGRSPTLPACSGRHAPSLAMTFRDLLRRYVLEDAGRASQRQHGEHGPRDIHMRAAAAAARLAPSRALGTCQVLPSVPAAWARRLAAVFQADASKPVRPQTSMTDAIHVATSVAAPLFAGIPGRLGALGGGDVAWAAAVEACGIECARAVTCTASDIGLLLIVADVSWRSPAGDHSNRISPGVVMRLSRGNVAASTASDAARAQPRVRK